MTVYVDDMRAPLGRLIMCHMIADTDAELHEMVRLIGVSRTHHQGDHYDVCLGKKRLALAYGAVQITMRQCASMRLRRRVTGELGIPEDAIAWARQHLRHQRHQRSNHMPPPAATEAA